MKNIFLLSILIFAIIISTANAYDELLFRPLTANVFEPRVGSFYQFNDKKLRLDIGTSVDLTDFKIIDETEVRLGTDFFTFTRLRSEGNFKFPVETSDYFFGVNATSKRKTNDFTYYCRLRIAHISSHLVDGMAKDTIFKRPPFVYSREFSDLTGALEYKDLRIYVGFTYVFSTIPKNVNEIIPQIGFDWQSEIITGIKAAVGYDFKLTGWDKTYNGVHSAQAGLIFITSGSIGIAINGFFYDGLSMHGMYYRQRDSYGGLGFQVIFY